MNLDLGEDRELLRRTVREFAEARIAPVAAELDREHRFPYDIVAGLAELGVMGIPIPEDHGGAGLDTLSYALVVEELARVDSSVAITVAAHTSLGTMPILLFGTDEQRRRWLPDLASGRRLAAFGLTEPEAGSDAGATRSRAEEREGSWVVNGSKMFITNAGTDITACVTITAVTGERDGEPEISNLIVPAGTPGLEVSPPLEKLGWRASDTRELSFRDCTVPWDALVGERGDGFRQFLEILDGGRISVAALAVGLSQGAYEQALAYAKGRQQFGRPIGRFQAVQFKLADMATEIAAARSLVLAGGLAEGRGPAVRPRSRDGEAVLRARFEPRGQRGARAARRLRLHGGDADRALLPRPEGARDRRGDERDPASRDRARPWPVTQPSCSPSERIRGLARNRHTVARVFSRFRAKDVAERALPWAPTQMGGGWVWGTPPRLAPTRLWKSSGRALRGLEQLHGRVAQKRVADVRQLVDEPLARRKLVEGDLAGSVLADQHLALRRA